MTDEVREAFFESYDLAGRVMRSPAVAEGWAQASVLAGLSVGGVAAHVYAAMRRFEVALDEALPDVPVAVTLPEFYGRNRVEHPTDLDGGLHALIREDAERRASYGPDAVAERFAELGRRLRDRLTSEPDDRPVPVWTVEHGVTTLHTYLATRVVELVVHSDDLAASVGLPAIDVPPAAASASIGSFVRLARARAGDLAVIRAFARAERADEGTLRVL